MAFIINCDCGVVVRGVTEDEIAESATDHARTAHDMTVTRAQVLALAESE